MCGGFPDARKDCCSNIAIADFGLSAFALFFMQSASFLAFQRTLEKGLAFQRTLEKGHGRSNCRTLFGIEKIPSDNYIRDVPDAADPALLQPCFERIEQLLATVPLRQDFARSWRPYPDRLGRHRVFLLAKSSAVQHCLEARNAPTARWRATTPCLAATAVAPGHSKVVPLFPESGCAAGRRRKTRLRTQRRQAAGMPSTPTGCARCVPSISATICSPASPSSPCWRTLAMISSSPARKSSLQGPLRLYRRRRA